MSDSDFVLSQKPTTLKPTTFIFDFFGVISKEVINGWFREHVLKRGLTDPRLKEILGQLDMGRIGEDDILNHFLEYDFLKGFDKEELRAQVDSYFQVDTQLMALIAQLKQKGFKTALLSNANVAFFNKNIFSTFPEFKNMFDHIVISSEVQMIKPNPEMFLYTLNKLNSSPQETLFIDDNPENISAAQKLGINGLLYVYGEREAIEKYTI